MKILRKIFLTIGISIILIIGVALDFYDRGIFDYRTHEDEGLEQFRNHKTTEEVEKAYIDNFSNPNYRFPRSEVNSIKIYKNRPIISRFSSKTLSRENQIQIIDFFNNPDNFDWGETTWNLNEAEYIVRFFDKKNDNIGTVWLCINDCGMTCSKPFSPNMKFGALSKSGREKINLFLETIY